MKQADLVRIFLDELEECIDEGCVDSVPCFLDNLARVGLKLTPDLEMESSNSYFEEILK